MKDVQALKKDIQQIMSDFIENEDAKVGKVITIKMYDYFEPHLLGYMFREILGFDVRFRIFEKENYIISFGYKKFLGVIRHAKLSYTLRIDKQYEKEVIDALTQAKQKLEELFYLLTQEALDNDKYMLPNEVFEYRERLFYFKEQISGLQAKLKKPTKPLNKDADVQGFMKHLEDFFNVPIKHNREISYNAEAYIEVAYSYIEHYLTLLSAFCQYAKPFHSSLRISWDKKFDLVFGTSDKSTSQIKNELSQYKQIYRNRMSHGMFSQEQKLFVSIKHLGNYPFFYGKNLKGFNGNKDYFGNNFSFVDLNTFNEFEKLLQRFDSLCEDKYELEKMLIDNYLPIHVDMSIYNKALKGEKEMQGYIDYTHYQMDRSSNMDW